MSCLSELEPCAGKYCARTVLNNITCLFTECQVKSILLFKFSYPNLLRNVSAATDHTKALVSPALIRLYSMITCI